MLRQRSALKPKTIVQLNLNFNTRWFELVVLIVHRTFVPGDEPTASQLPAKCTGS